MGVENLPDSKFRIQSLQVSPVDTGRIFLLGPSTLHWTTDNGGRSYQLVNHNMRIHEVKMHPRQAESVLVSTMTERCHDMYANGVCYKNLFLSKDFGRSFKFMHHYIVQFDWAHSLPKHHANNYALETIFFTEYEIKGGNQKFGSWQQGINFCITRDYFKNIKVLVKRGNRFLFTSEYMFIAQAHKQFTDQVVLVITRDGAKSFHEASMPQAVKQHSYTVLDSSDHTVFLHVNHDGQGGGWGHVYTSNAYGLNYTLSLPGNRRADNGKCDFEKMEGLEGHYIANYIVGPPGTQVAGTAYDDLDSSTGSVHGISHVKTGRVKHIENIKTVVSYDKGAVWNLLNAPKFDANGAPVHCQDSGCSLHLHGITSEFGPFYTAGSSIGLVLATGNIGMHLSSRPQEVNTYFSRDAGLTWFEIAKGSHIYEFGDHGALIVMAKDLAVTDSLYYTWDEGMHWNSVKIVKEPFEVVNIIIEPEATSQRFVVYGARQTEEGKTEGVLVYVDFANLHERPCRGAHEAGSADSDYEHWTPSDGRHGEECFMGHEIMYTRRKRSSSCFNGIAFERPRKVHDCQCTEQDYECDIGYTRPIGGGLCRKVEGVNVSAFNNLHHRCPSGEFYYITTGYRKVPGDTCIGGLNRARMKLPCGTTGGLSWYARFVLLLLLVLIAGLYYVNSTSENVPQLLESVLETLRGTVGKVWNLVKNRGSGAGASKWSRGGSGWSSGPSSEGYGAIPTNESVFTDDDDDEGNVFDMDEDDESARDGHAISNAIGGGGNVVDIYNKKD